MKYPRKFGYVLKKNRVPQVSEKKTKHLELSVKKPNTLKPLGQAICIVHCVLKILRNFAISYLLHTLDIILKAIQFGCIFTMSCHCRDLRPLRGSEIKAGSDATTSALAMNDEA